MSGYVWRGSTKTQNAAGTAAPACSADPVDAQIRAEIQLVGLISAIKGFAITKPEMTVVELESRLKMILAFARSALEADQQNVELSGKESRREDG